MPRILVFMSDNRPLETTIAKADYNSLVASINYEYCKKYGYDFIYYRPYLEKKDDKQFLNCKNPITGALRHPSWSKLHSAHLSLKLDYDYVVYIDSDCIFKDFNKSLYDFIEPFSKNDILFLNDKPWRPYVPCAGFFILRVSEYVKDFVQHWYYENIPGKDAGYPWEQTALWNIFSDVSSRSYRITLIDSWMFLEKKNQFLRHVYGGEGPKRIPYFTSFIQSKKINYAKNISDIRVVEFDTNNRAEF